MQKLHEELTTVAGPAPLTQPSLTQLPRSTNKQKTTNKQTSKGKQPRNGITTQPNPRSTWGFRQRGHRPLHRYSQSSRLDPVISRVTTLSPRTSPKQRRIYSRGRQSEPLPRRIMGWWRGVWRRRCLGAGEEDLRSCCSQHLPVHGPSHGGYHK